MHRNQHRISAGDSIILLLVILNILIIRQGFLSHSLWYKLLLLSLPMLMFSLIFFRKNRL
ncbi:MAG TPA: hypothetical protein VGC29_06475 [Flavisolibacter sp.]